MGIGVSAVIDTETDAPAISHTKQAQTKILLEVKHKLNDLLTSQGVCNHSPAIWLAELTADLGVVGDCVLDAAEHEDVFDANANAKHLDQLEDDLLSLAETAVAAVESIRRQRGNGWL